METESKKLKADFFFCKQATEKTNLALLNGIFSTEDNCDLMVTMELKYFKGGYYNKY